MHGKCRERPNDFVQDDATRPLTAEAMPDEEDQPRDVRSGLYTLMQTAFLSVGPSSKPMPKGFRSPTDDRLFLLQVWSADGTAETLTFEKEEWKRVLSNMIGSLAASGDAMGQALLKWCEQNLGRAGEEDES